MIQEIISESAFVLLTETIPNKLNELKQDYDSLSTEQRQIITQLFFDNTKRIAQKERMIKLIEEINSEEYVSDVRKYINELEQIIESL